MQYGLMISNSSQRAETFCSIVTGIQHGQLSGCTVVGSISKYPSSCHRAPKLAVKRIPSPSIQLNGNHDVLSRSFLRSKLQWPRQLGRQSYLWRDTRRAHCVNLQNAACFKAHGLTPHGCASPSQLPALESSSKKDCCLARPPSSQSLLSF